MKHNTRPIFFHTRFMIIALVLLASALACQAAGGTPVAEDLPAPVEETEADPPSSIAPDTDPAAIGSTPPQPATSNSSDELLSAQEALVALYEYVSPGVVAIRTFSELGAGQGSGFVIDMEGHIVTNNHVIEEATELEIAFSSGYKTRGTILGVDLDSDLAVIKVDVPPEQLHPVPMGDSDLIKVGQTVVAIGNPFGYGGTMTVGIISAKGRTLDSMRAAPSGLGFFTAGDLIQTDAAINPGNSGGPLFNLDGEVVGVNRAISTFSFDEDNTPLNSGIGFAISINIVKRVVPALIEIGHYDYPYIGVSSLSEITLLDQEQYSIPQTTGAYITFVNEGSPADQAGLQTGDLIIGIDGREVIVFGDLLSYLLNQKGPGDEVLLDVLRDDEQIQLALILGKRP